MLALHVLRVETLEPCEAQAGTMRPRRDVRVVHGASRTPVSC
jgi:hypothetical protein